jgi:hypothetical protein
VRLNGYGGEIADLQPEIKSLPVLGNHRESQSAC